MKEGGRKEREREREREGEREVLIVPRTFSPWRISLCFNILHCTVVCVLIGWLSEMEEKNNNPERKLNDANGERGRER